METGSILKLGRVVAEQDRLDPSRRGACALQYWTLKFDPSNLGWNWLADELWARSSSFVFALHLARAFVVGGREWEGCGDALVQDPAATVSGAGVCRLPKINHSQGGSYK